jgi:hypothetical protein
LFVVAAPVGSVGGLIRHVDLPIDRSNIRIAAIVGHTDIGVVSLTITVVITIMLLIDSIVVIVIVDGCTLTLERQSASEWKPALERRSITLSIDIDIARRRRWSTIKATCHIS